MLLSEILLEDEINDKELELDILVNLSLNDDKLH